MSNSTQTSMNETTTETPYRELTLQEALSSPLVVIWCLLLALLLILIMFGNVTVMRTVHLTPKLHYSAFYFVFSLALADFMVGFLVPLSLVHIVADKMKGRWIAGEVACDFWTFANIWFVVASLLNLCSVSWDRYVAVTSPFNYKQRMRTKKVKILIAMVWGVSLFIGILYTIAFKFSEERELCKASGIDFKPAISFFVIVYVIPTLFLLFVNVKVIIIARRHRRNISAQEVAPTWITEEDSTSTNMEIKNDKRKSMLFNEVKTIKTFVIVIGTFIVCYTPFFVLLLMNLFVAVEQHMPHVAVILFYVKSGLNPMIYGVSSKDLRVAAANSLRRKKRIEANNQNELDIDRTTSVSNASVLKVPDEADNRVPSPLKIDDIIPNANDSEK